MSKKMLINYERRIIKQETEIGIKGRRLFRRYVCRERDLN